MDEPFSDTHHQDTPPADHSGLAARRVVFGGGGGLAAAAVAVVLGASWSVAALCASDVAALVFVAWVWLTVAAADPKETARIARAEDASRTAAEAVLLVAGAASLVAVAFTLGQASHTGPPDRGLLTALALASVALAWTSVHTVFVLRYARLYYSPPEGGVDFHDETPDYHDFAYLALTIGMTFQVSDTDLTGKCIGRDRPPSRTPLLRLRDRDRRDHGQLGCRPPGALAQGAAYRRPGRPVRSQQG